MCILNERMRCEVPCATQREAEQEAARLSAIKDSKQREFEKQEAQAAAELKQRVDVEQQTIVEQQQRQRAELERHRR